MVSKTPRTPPQGSVKLEDRYGKVAIKAVAGAISTQKTAKTGS